MPLELGTAYVVTVSVSGADRRYMGLCGGLLGQVWPGAGTYFNNTVCQHQSPGACVSRRTNRCANGQVLRLSEAEFWSTALHKLVLSPALFPPTSHWRVCLLRNVASLQFEGYFQF